ncbi:hypothetical protein MKW92_046568 [Papaver armeniacum]|nr:hypothetical protein MKW92_046568 [Papaver armeniacum]
MINIWPDSLLLAAVYGLVEAASTALFGPIIGKLVDGHTYVQVLRLWLLAQSLSFVVAGATVTSLLVYPGLRFSGFAMFVSLVVLTNVSGAVGDLSTLAGTILVEREWVVVITAGEPPEILTKMNSVIRRIDLNMNFLHRSRHLLGLSHYGTFYRFWLQYWLLKSVYDGTTALTENDVRRNSSILTDNSILPSHEGSNSVSEAEHSWIHNVIEHLSKVAFFDAWIVYLRQDVLLPGIALSLLYLTVLR